MSQSLKFSVQSKSQSAARTEVNTRGFTLLVDEPESLGGTNLAPNPVEYVLAGYAGCVNVVAHIVAKELQIRLPDLQVNIEGEINPTRLLGTAFTDRAGYKSLTVQLKTSEPLTDDLKTRLLKAIEDRCPVNDNLTNPTPINFFVN
jgi:uncharacterized OsmC-like protein